MSLVKGNSGRVEDYDKAILLDFQFFSFLRGAEAASWFKVRGAMRTTGSFYRNGRKTKRTLFGCWNRRRSHFLFLASIDGPNEQEDGKGYNKKVDDRVDENAEIYRHRSGSFGGYHRGVRSSNFAFLEDDEDVGEIHVTQEKSDRRHYHITHQGSYNSTESGPNDNTDGHVQYIPPHSEFFEFF
jgi:hypothetical protein